MAEHRFTIPGTPGPEIVVRTRPVGYPDVLVDGRPVEREALRGRPVWPIRLADGSEKLLFLRGSITGLVGAVDGELIRIERRLALWELLLCIAPFSMAALGSIGAVIGFACSVANLRLVRRAPTAAGRLATLLASFALALAITLGIVGLVYR